MIHAVARSAARVSGSSKISRAHLIPLRSFVCDKQASARFRPDNRSVRTIALVQTQPTRCRAGRSCTNEAARTNKDCKQQETTAPLIIYDLCAAFVSIAQSLDKVGPCAPRGPHCSAAGHCSAATEMVLTSESSYDTINWAPVGPPRPADIDISFRRVSWRAGESAAAPTVLTSVRSYRGARAR